MKKFYMLLLALGLCTFGLQANTTDNTLPESCEDIPIATVGGPVIPPNTLYAITFGDAPNNFGRFSYFPDSDVINYDSAAAVSLAEEIPYGMAYSPTDGTIYAILGLMAGAPREMFSLDPNTGTTVNLGAVVSAGGATNASAMAISNDGTVYITFGSGEINTYNIGTSTASALGTLPPGGGAGLTYDFDNDRLIYATGTDPVTLHEINTTTGAFTTLFTFDVPGATGPCTGQAIHYVGADKLISSSTFDCGIIYTVNVDTEATASLVDPNPFDLSVKQFVYINNDTPFSVSCNDATVEVQSDLSIPFNGGTVTNAINNLYAMDLNLTTGVDDVHLYNYDPTTDDISVKTPVVTSTGPDQFFAMDWHPVENQVYILQDNTGGRSLHTFDLATGTATLIAPMISDGGDGQAQDMTFGADGALYVTFQSGEIGIYDFATDTMLPFADLGATGSAGGVGLTYDFDNNRLLHASGTANITVNAVDLATAAVSVVTTFVVPDGGCGGTSQGIEYVGADKAVSSTTFGCDTIYTIDLLTGDAVAIRNPAVDDGFDVRIKDLMYVGMTVTLDPASFTCDDLGDNKITIDVVDYAGNMSSCFATLTITDPNDFCGLSVDDFTAQQVVMYPNPAGDQFQIQWNANEALQSIQIFDISGKQVLTLEVNQNTSTVIDISELAMGLYVVKFESAAGTAVKRLIKQ